MCIYEIDHPVTQAQKIKKIERMQGKIPDNMTFIAIDFDKEELEDSLKKSSFDSRAKTLFVWEAVSQYIEEESVHKIFSCLSSMVSSESYIIFTYIDKNYIKDGIDSKRNAALAGHQERLNEPWLFGIDSEQISSFLSSYGFHLAKQSGAPDYRKLYMDPMGRQMNVFEGELVILACVEDVKKED
jgi:methyltransferase (TIGR00027 family)